MADIRLILEIDLPSRIDQSHLHASNAVQMRHVCNVAAGHVPFSQTERLCLHIKRSSLP